VNGVIDITKQGAIIRQSEDTISINGLTSSKAIDADGNGMTDTTIVHTVNTVAGVRTEGFVTRNGDSTLRGPATKVSYCSLFSKRRTKSRRKGNLTIWTHGSPGYNIVRAFDVIEVVVARVA
jgi:hypothetical protein